MFILESYPLRLRHSAHVCINLYTHVHKLYERIPFETYILWYFN